MYSAAWVNQFEIKGACSELVIDNISLQGNNVKIKLNLKWKKFAKSAVLIFGEVNNNARHIRNPVKRQI